jgi:fructokinase
VTDGDGVISGRPRLYGGVETGGTKVACLLGSGPDDIVAETRFETGSPEATVAQIVAFFAAHERPDAVGVGAFGPIGVDPGAADWGVLGRTPKPGWSGFGLGPELARRTGLAVALDTDVNAAALGELRWGAGVGCSSVAFLTVGTGIGAGFVVDGRPLHGLLHPEAGHMRIPHSLARDPFPGACPFHGDCWEGLASGAAMAARWGVTGAELAPGHPGWELEAEYLAAGIANLVMIVSPQRFIVGGGVLGHPGLLDLVRERVASLLAGYLGTELLGARISEYLVAPGLGERAGTLGALALALALVAEESPRR